jgi:DNA-binding NtrC family response regulator
MARVLVAEQDPPIRRLIAGILADFGHDVRECAGPGETSACLQSDPVDVLVTDLVLCGRLGARLLRDTSALGVPTITLSGRECGPGAARRSRPAPLSRKPFRLADLKGVVDAVAAVTAIAAPYSGR